MATRKEFELAVRIAGLIDDSLNNSVNLTKKQLRSVAREAALTNSNTSKFGSAMESMGPGIDKSWNMATGAVKATAAAVAIATGAAIVAGNAIIDTGSEFESAFAGVRKTVDATEQQFADLEEGLRLMSKNKPQTAVELAEIAEAAGQLGIQTENIEDFTSTLADLKVATNLGDEGATQFAKFANITKMTQDKFDNLGSSVVALGNNTATTEADIMNMAMRVAAAGSQVGMSEADILGFSAALSSVGIEAEMGGSAISKTMIDMQLAVETGSARLHQYANVSKMTGEQFKKAFKEDAASALTAFLTGLADTEALGQSTIKTLDDMEISEVRLRDTLLRAASASGLFGDTIALSGKAFEENTALTREAEQRYATFESRVDMMNNRVKDLGITLYQDFRDPLSDALGVAMEFTDGLGMLDNDYLQGLADNFKKSIPTVIRQLGDAKDAVVDFAGPFIEVGDWMIEHPDVIAGGLAAIGTTIAGLKLVKTISGVAKALNTLRIAVLANPVTAVIGLTALAGGALIGLSTKVKIANDKLKKQDLAKHFGAISLSMEDLNQAAEQILGTENRKNLKLFTEQLNEMGSVTSKLDQHQRTLSKLNWKIEMGIELTEADRQNYTAAINGYVESSIEAVEQQHYTASIAIQTLFKGEGGEGILSSLNEFYSLAEADVRAAGERLGKAYNDAMEDGIVSPIEQETIEKLTMELQQAQAKVMENKSRVSWSIMSDDYFSGGKLDADSFLNLQDKVNEQTEKDLEFYRKAQEEALAANEKILNGILTDPESTDFAKEQAARDATERETSLRQEYQNRRIETQERAVSFTMDTLDTQYPEVAKQLDGFNEHVSDYLSKSMEIDPTGWITNTSEKYIEALEAIKDGVEIPQATRAAMEEVLKGLEPQTEDWEAMAESYRARGEEIPKAIQEGLSKVSLLKALIGDEGEITKLMNEQMGDSPEAKELFKQAEEFGSWVPESFSNGMTENISSIDQAAQEAHDYTQKTLDNNFNLFTVNGGVIFDLSVEGITLQKPALKTGKIPEKDYGNKQGEVFIPGLATGGIIESERLTWFAEDGPEAAIPLDGSQRSKSIWQEAGERLGVLDTGGIGGAGTGGVYGNNNSYSTGSTQNRSESQIVYSPVYHISGPSAEAVKQATSDDFKRFESFMRQYKKDKARLAF